MGFAGALTHDSKRRYTHQSSQAVRVRMRDRWHDDMGLVAQSRVSRVRSRGSRREVRRGPPVINIKGNVIRIPSERSESRDPRLVRRRSCGGSFDYVRSAHSAQDDVGSGKPASHVIPSERSEPRDPRLVRRRSCGGSFDYVRFAHSAQDDVGGRTMRP